MKIISITVSSDTKETIIGDALRSVIDWVDVALLVHILDFGHDNTQDVFKSIVGKKMRVICVDKDTPFAEIRNAGLRFCNEVAWTDDVWSCQLDTDERILTNNVNIRATLAKLDQSIQAVTVLDDTGSYDKVRFIRHHTSLRFSQDFHEELVPEPKSCSITQVRFHELLKTPEQIHARIFQQIEHASRQINADPMNPRWHYYLASALEKAGRCGAAIDEYTNTIPLFKNSEAKAWCWFRMACCYFQQGQYGHAMRAAMDGMIQRPDYPELPWVIASVQLALKNWRDAVSWARIAALNGWSRKNPTEINRIGFKEPIALYEGPYQIMSAAHAALGNQTDAAWATAEMKRAVKARKMFFEKGI